MRAHLMASFEEHLTTSMSHMVHVVSMLEVPRRLRSVSFQSKDVRGALNSLFLFCRCQTNDAHPCEVAGLVA